MSRSFQTHIDLGQNELQNGVAQNLSTAPTAPAPKRGQFYFNTGDNTLYWYDGTAWVSSRGGGTGFPGFGSVSAETVFGSASSDGVGATSSRTDHKHGNPAHDAAAHSGIPLSSLSAPFGAVTAEPIAGSASADGTGTSAARNEHKHGNPTHTSRWSIMDMRIFP